MKVLYIVNSSDFFFSHFLALAKKVLEKGHEVYVVAGDDSRKYILESMGFYFISVRLSRSGMNPLNELYSVIQFRKYIQLINPDVLHLFTIKPIIYAGLSLKSRWFSKAPIVCYSVTGLGSAYLSTGLLAQCVWTMLKFLYRTSFSVANSFVFFENEDDRSLFVKQGILTASKSFIVDGAGIDTSIFTPSEIKSDVPTVVLVARLLKDKGVAEYIEAGKILKQRNINVRLQLVGCVDNGNISSMSQKDIDAANDSGFIESLGHRTDVADIYRAAHIACLPSYREGLPKSLIEAASCGLPIITTDVPGCRQMVRDNQNGLLIEVKSAIAIADAVMHLISNPELMRSMGLCSRKIAEEKFDYKHIIGNFFKIYKIPLYEE